MTPAEFLARWTPFQPVNHHFTGHHTPENTGSVLHHEGVILATLAYNLGGPVLEIGAEKGVSTRYIHEGLAARQKLDKPPEKVYSVDIRHWWGDDPSFPLRVKVDADSAFYTPPEPCAWAFIDGNHVLPLVRLDIIAAERAGAKALLFHDTGANNPWQPGPRQAAIELPPLDWDVTFIDTQCGMVFAEKVTK